ncbi:MAG: DapH/DapD/GlmU-related protein [Desulfuromonadaceae bacterium]|nr:DapH/DapD/GlmU-related protein [Desulfuromonadaceae bacterium]
MRDEGFFSLIKLDLSRLSQQSSVEKLSVQYWKIIHPRFMPVLIIRLARLFHATLIFRPLAVVLTWMNVFIFGIEVTPRCRIAGGLFLPHTSGTVIGAASIGLNATIFQGVTIGAKYADMDYTHEVRPTLENDVVVGAGAKVLGGINIGSGARVAANSLVLIAVPTGATAIGVPAIIKRRHEHN